MNILLLLSWSLVLAAVPAGLVYGRHLAQQNLNLESAFQGFRGMLVLLSFVGSMALLYLSVQQGHALHPLLNAGMEAFSWAVIQAMAVFLAAIAWMLEPGLKRLPPAGFALFSLFGVQWVQATLNQPLKPELFSQRLASDGSILQSTQVSCTAAAMANGLKFLGIDATEQQVAAVLGTRRSGTTAYQVMQAAPHFGLQAEAVRVSATSLQSQPLPVIITVDLFDINHSVLIERVDSRGNLLGVDPVAGRVTYSPEHLQKQLKSSWGVLLKR